MGLETFKLIEKNKLTHDIYELIFELGNEVKMLPGQFITFILPKLGGRAYSILEGKGKTITLIIKRREEGRGGSKHICDLNTGDILSGVGPAGHFVLRNTDNNKIFFGTGTGFVPLFNQIKGAIKNDVKSNLKLVFGVREEKDLFYIDKLKELELKYPNFTFEVFLSRDDLEGFRKGYVTEFISKKNVEKQDEFYICGMHMMIDSVIDKLKSLGVNENKIITEKY